MNSKFYKCAIFSFYIDNQIRWFRFLNFKISFKHILKYKFNSNNPKGFIFGWWLITISKN